MGSDAFQVDGVGIGMNCGTLSWCQRIAGGVGTPPPHTTGIGTRVLPSHCLHSLNVCMCVLVYCLSHPLEYKLQDRWKREPHIPTFSVPGITQSSPQTPSTCLLNE